MKTTSSGKWTDDEHRLFIKGCIEHGWGQWKHISAAIPTKRVNQVKQHAEKFNTQLLGQRRLLESAHARVMRISAEGNAAGIAREFAYFMSCVDSGKASIMHLQMNQYVPDEASQLSKNASRFVGSFGNSAVAAGIPSNPDVFRPIEEPPAMIRITHPLKPQKKQHVVPEETSQLSQNITRSIGSFENSAVVSAIPSNVGVFRPIGKATAMMQGSSPNKVVRVPSKFDVLTALGEAYTTQHSGNRRFQTLIKKNLPRFKSVPTIRGRYALIDEMLHAISSSGGRFLVQKSDKANHWKVLSHQGARRKIEATFNSYLNIPGSH